MALAVTWDRNLVRKLNSDCWLKAKLGAVSLILALLAISCVEVVLCIMSVFRYLQNPLEL